MKNIFVFYLYFFLPLPFWIEVVFIPPFQHYFSKNMLLSFLMAYILIYRSVVVGIRLIETKKIPWAKFWYNFIPGWNRRYFGFIFFNKG